MSNNSGKATTYIVIILLIIVLAAVVAIMYYPPAKPARDFLAVYIPALSDTAVVIDDNLPVPIVTAPTGPVNPVNPASQAANPDPNAPVQSGADNTQIAGNTAAAQPSSDASQQPPIGTVFPITGLISNPFGGTSNTQAGPPAGTEKAPAVSDNSPGSIVKACMSKLQSRDIIGAEQYVSENGKQFTMSGMTGIHKVLMKNMVDVRSFDEIGYKDAKIYGQTAWVPIYSKLDAKSKIVSLYILVANRGDGWKVDDLYDPRR
ncbi:MAG: hypothetical protein ACYC27_01575 [Armatimonadota bacterium]